MKQGRVEFVNTLRGMAALSVLIAHYFGVFWAAPDTVSAYTNAPPAAVTLPTYLAWLHIFPKLEGLAASVRWLYRPALGFSFAAPYVVFMFIGTAFYFRHVGVIGPGLASCSLP